MHDSAQISTIKLAASQKEMGALRDWYTKQHANWVGIPGQKSKWWVWNRAVALAKEGVMTIQEYLQRVADGE